MYVASQAHKTLILSGNQAGLAAAQFTSLATSVSALSGGSIGRSAAAINMLATAGVRGATHIRNFSAAAVELERVGGQSIEQFKAAVVGEGVEAVAVQGLPVGAPSGSTWPSLTRGGGTLNDAA